MCFGAFRSFSEKKFTNFRVWFGGLPPLYGHQPYFWDFFLLKASLNWSWKNLNVGQDKVLKESMKKLGLNPAKYHGGDLEGKAVQDQHNPGKVLFQLLDCINDKPDIKEKFV